MAEKPCGGIWKKTAKNNKEYLSINIEIDGKKVYFNAFLNEKKEGQQPDYHVHESVRQS